MIFQLLAMFKTENGTKIDFSKSREIAAGGEGRILEHPTDTKSVVKVYHTPRKIGYEKHLKALSSLGKDFVKPEDIYFNDRMDVVGFSMAYVNFNDYFLFNNLFNKGFCSTNNITKDFKVSILKDFRKILEELHSKDIQVGDLNQYNIFFSKSGKLLFVDVDSFQTKIQPHSNVLIDDIRDWTTTQITNETDAWSYDILSFWSTTFVHPFKWVVKGNTETIEQRVRARKSILTKIQDVKIPPLYEEPSKELSKQFLEIFSGRRYMIEFDNIVLPVNVVVKQNNTSSSQLSINLISDNVRGVFVCGNQMSIKIGDVWNLYETKIPKVVRKIKELKCDYLYPSDTHFAYVIGDSLFSKADLETTFLQPVFYYNNGFLSVIEYGRDLQWTFNVDNQLAGIECGNTPVFAKSIIVRDSPVQNFGAKKYLNIPFNKSFNLVEVDPGTKDASYLNGYVALEARKKNITRFSIIDSVTKKDIEFNHFPNFTTKGKTLFVTEDGFIDVYQDFSLVSRFSVDFCTTSSKIYSSNSGLILFENNSVYLLNTK